jgi:tetratricopeptide (TPR) repeat protein
LCLNGRLLAESGDGSAALDALSAAIDADERLAEAWAIRAAVRYDAGDQVGAIDDLNRAIELADTPEFRFNRAVAYEAAGRLTDALADYEVVFDATGDADAGDRLAALRNETAAARDEFARDEFARDEFARDEFARDMSDPARDETAAARGAGR